ncbi:MAG: rRNA pseudouridine synthase [Candidatus Pacebacteria bacterium]|nr:rRNA pseudouridine synthase [Candidatus Paceibacterota bacterium]
MIYPIRINKYLAEKKICSRREADELIKAGKININSKVAELGEMVLESDEVVVDGNLKKLVYLAYNKPKGIVTHTGQEGETSISDIIKLDSDVYPLGRLDKDSRGLILLTNDGRVTDKLLNPIYFHDKEYIVKVNKFIDENFENEMTRGVQIGGGYKTKKCKFKKIDDFTFSIILIEGKNRQIRNMCKVLGFGVVDLKRIRVMNVELEDLKQGRYRVVNNEEKDKFLADLGL